MQKIYLLLTLLVFTSLYAAQDYSISFNQPQENVYELSYNLWDYSIVTKTIDGKEYSIIVFDAPVSLKQNGYADLPVASTALRLPDDKNTSMSVEGDTLVSPRWSPLIILALMAWTIWGGLSDGLWYFLLYSAHTLGLAGSTFPLFLLSASGLAIFAFSAAFSARYQYRLEGKKGLIARGITVFGYKVWNNSQWMRTANIMAVDFVSEKTSFGTRESQIKLKCSNGQKKHLLSHCAPSSLSEGYTKEIAWNTATFLQLPLTTSEEPKMLPEQTEELVPIEAPSTFSVTTAGNIMRNVLASTVFTLFYGGFCWLAMTGALGLAGPTLPWAFALAVLFVALAFAAAWTRRFSYAVEMKYDDEKEQIVPRLQLYGIPFPSLFHQNLDVKDIAEVWHLRLKDSTGTLERVGVKLKNGLWRFIAASSPIDPSGDDLQKVSLQLAALAGVPCYISEAPSIFLTFRSYLPSELEDDECYVDETFLAEKETLKGGVTSPSALPCEFCQEHVQSGIAATCKHCGALYHLYCWREEQECLVCGENYALVGPAKREALPQRVSCAHLPWFAWSRFLLLSSSFGVAIGLYFSWTLSPLLLIPTFLYSFVSQLPLTLINENVIDRKSNSIGKRRHLFGLLLGPLTKNVLSLNDVREVEQTEELTPAGQVVKGVRLVMKDGTRLPISFGAAAPCRAHEWLAEYIAQAANTTVHQIKERDSGKKTLPSRQLKKLPHLGNEEKE